MKLVDLLKQYLLLKNEESNERFLEGTEEQLEMVLNEEISAELLHDLGIKHITFILPTQTVDFDFDSF